MRINVYSQELLTHGGDILFGEAPAVEYVEQTSNTGAVYSAVRLFLHSSERLHRPPQDDDRSAITFWLPKSQKRREAFANHLRALAHMVETAASETGIDE